MSTTTTHAGRAVQAMGREPDAVRDERPATQDVADDTARGAGPRALRLTPRHVWFAAALVLVAALVFAATTGRDWYAARQADQAHAEATAAARQLAINFVTVDYRKVDADTARVKAGATGTFLSSYSSSVEELKKVLVANQTVSTVQRSEAALVSGDRDSAVALVGVVAPTRNTSVPGGETKTYRMRLDLRKVGEAWKVENLEFVG